MDALDNRSMLDRVALVTGAASGIGRASALALARRGAYVVVADIDEDGGRETVDAIGVGGAEFQPLDVTDGPAVERAVDGIVDRRGGLHYVHNNAGISSDDHAVHEIPDELWDRVLAVDLRGAWLVLKHSLRAMRAGEGGSIVNTASIAATSAIAGRGAYCSAKAGLVMLTRVAALENGAHGIRVNAIAPGTIATPMSSRTRFASGPDVPGPPPTGRLGTADEVAEAVVWLCSDAASYVNGVCLTIDGGWTTSVPGRETLETAAT